MSLLSLPNEILFAIADYLKLLPDLNAFARTNHRCYAAFNRQLYVYGTKEEHIPGFLWALESGQSKTVQYFLDVGAITGPCAAETIQTSLLIASRHEYPRTVALLILYGVKMCIYMKDYCQDALAEAVKYDRVEVVKVLVENGADLEYVYGDGRRPLHIAAKSNSGQMIKFLFGCGVSFYALDQSNTSALHIAAMKGKENAVRALLDCGFNPNFFDYEGDAPIHRVAKAYRRTSPNFLEGQLAVTRALLEYGANPYLKNRYGFMPLWIAAFLNRTIFLEILLKYGVNSHGLDANGHMQEPMPIGDFRVMVRDTLSDYTSHYPQVGHDGHLNCCTPLCIAAFLGCEGAVKLLLEHGANPNGIDPNGEMPLHLAVRDKNCAVAERLIKNGACLESRDCHGRTPIDWALSFGGQEMIQLLRDKGASARSIDWRGIDPIFRALDYGHTADWSAVRRGLLPPHIVDWADDYTICHQQRWPYYRYPGDWDGGEPHECESVVEWLLEEGSKVDSRDSLGRTLLHQAAFQNCEGTIKLLLKRGADPMAKDIFGQTPLHMACAPFIDLAEDAFEILLAAGSDPNSRDINGETPLHQAARAGFYWAPHLLKADGRVNYMAKDNNGNTALHLAVMSGRGEEGDLMIKALRRAGVDCSMVNNNGQTAMDLTRDWSEESTIIALSCELSEESDEYEYEDPDLEML